MFYVKEDPTGKFEGAVDEEGFWYNEGPGIRCTRFASPLFPRQKFAEDLAVVPTRCFWFSFHKFYRSYDDWMSDAVIMEPNALKEDVEHDMALAERIDREARYENDYEDLGRPGLAEDDPVRQAMILGDGNRVCELLGIDDRFRLYKDGPDGPCRKD